MNSEEGYNGWANYETWVVKLWIDNDRPYYEFCKEMALDILDRCQWNTVKAMHELADSISDILEECNPVTGADMYSDLMRRALSKVDCHEIAQSILGDVQC